MKVKDVIDEGLSDVIHRTKTFYVNVYAHHDSTCHRTREECEVFAYENKSWALIARKKVAARVGEFDK